MREGIALNSGAWDLPAVQEDMCGGGHVGLLGWCRLETWEKNPGFGSWPVAEWVQ